jgi:hypothetical protein
MQHAVQSTNREVRKAKDKTKIRGIELGSIPIARSTSRLASGYEIGVNTLMLWESVGNGRRFDVGLVPPHFSK